MSETEETLPRATVQKIIKEILMNPENEPSTKEFSCAKETVDILSSACLEFIKMISMQSNEICEKDKKKTIAPEHAIQAISTLGWDKHEKDLKDTWENSREVTKAIQERSHASRHTAGMSEAELLAAQEQLFAASRARFDASGQQ
ncbi:negative cofactor 2 transcription regulator complex subunit ncb2 [Naganishia albida]|nr:negative cofactor 2 transcription regulator complex subunit ncb2 [Naganishia albida]